MQNDVILLMATFGRNQGGFPVGTTDKKAARLLGITVTFTLRGDHPVSVNSICETLRQVESESPWKFETGNTGIYLPSVKPLGIDRIIAGNTILTEGSFELAWVYGQGDAITRNQEDAFIAYLVRVGRRLEEEVGMTISGVDMKMVISIVFD